MKPAYYEKNHEGFEGDTFLADKVKSLIDKFGVKWAIETGTYRAATTKRLSEWVELVNTIEIDHENFNISKDVLRPYHKALPHRGSSNEVLPRILKYYSSREQIPQTLFYLDAHFNLYCPLLDELNIIAEYKLKPVIVIHDFQVPGHPELGFDEYNGQPFTWEWIKESVEKIYGVDGYNIEYNSEATGAKRGVIFLSPKQ